MKKNLTISIAAYNIEKYIERALDSLIIKSIDKLEVLIVNDGSTDNTAKIASKYCEKYPDTFKLINKKNGGYGSTINTGIKHAKGKYFKQLDGDDWYDTDGLEMLVTNIDKIDSDVIYTPFMKVYDNDGSTVADENPILMHKNKNKLIEDVINDSEIIYMYNLAYKTKLLQDNKIKIDENCFYTDTEYVVLPLMCAKTIYILDYYIYMYRLGVEGQSVSVSGRKKHWKDHYRISYTLMNFYDEKQEKLDFGLRGYYEKYLASVFSSGIGNYLFTLEPTRDNFELIKKYDLDIKNISKKIYDIMAKNSRAVVIIRKNNYFLYKMLTKYKHFKWKI